MPIEFRCHQCGKLLRVGDETAGKQAKCPSCGSVQAIPVASPAPEMPSPPPFSEPAGNPFGAAPPMLRTTPGAELNPYQAPPSYPDRGPFEASGVGTHGAYRPTRIDIGDVLSRSWEIYKDQLWMCVGVFALCLIINYAAQFPSQIINMALPAAQFPLSAIIFVNLVLAVLQMLFQMWIGVGQTMFFLKVARGETASVGMIFEGGAYLLRTVAATLLFALGAIGVAIVCAIPAVGVYFATEDVGAAIGAFVLIFLIPQLYLSLTFLQYFYLIVDHDLGAIDSLYASREITRGNRLSIFAVMLICGLLYLAGVFACCVGALFTGAYAVLSITVMYLVMSGGQTAPRFQR